METAARIKGEVEPIWAIASIFLLGALVTLCTKCRNVGELKEDSRFRKSRSLNTTDPGFQIVRSFTMAEVSNEGAYLEPLVSNYYNCGAFLKPPKREEDGNSYVNILILPVESSDSETDETADYANTTQLKQQPRKNSGSSENDYTDPDYINATLPRSKKISDSN
ncbi:linker for activation of T-cells family member 2 isoform X3 [Lissotriton helveticus]